MPWFLSMAARPIEQETAGARTACVSAVLRFEHDGVLLLASSRLGMQGTFAGCVFPRGFRATEESSGHQSHDHSHAPGGNHAHAPKNLGTAFAIGTALNLGFVLVELFYGVLANSMALVADAGHNLGDVLGLLLAWGAAVVRRAPSQTHTYGLRRATILAALANAVLMLVTVGIIAA